MQGFAPAAVYVFETVRANGGSTIARYHDRPAAPPAVPFLCECGNSLCPERIWLTPGEYETFQDNPLEPLLAPGHGGRYHALSGERRRRERRRR